MIIALIRFLLSLFSNTVLIIVLAASVACFGYFFDALGILPVPDAVWSAPLRLLTPRPPAVTVTIPEPEAPAWVNPLPDPTRQQASTPGPDVFSEPLTPTPEPEYVPVAPTPVPPMPAPEYRAAVMVHLRAFAQSAQNWLDANQQLTDEPELAYDPQWQNRAGLLLAQVVSAAQSLDQVGPAPAEYAGVDSRLKQLLPEAYALQYNYMAAMHSGDAGLFEAAGQNFANIKDILTLTVGEMQNAGWPVE